MKKRKMTTMLIKVLRHDFGFYNSVFKWDALPSPLDSSFEYLLPIIGTVGRTRIYQIIQNR